MKEIHFYENGNDCAIHSWNTVEYLILHQEPCIRTTQMGFLSWSVTLFELGYRIFIHESYKDFYEIKLGCDNERTNREIKKGHNIFKMWMSGEFMKKEQRKLWELDGNTTILIDSDYKGVDENEI